MVHSCCGCGGKAVHKCGKCHSAYYCADKVCYDNDQERHELWCWDSHNPKASELGVYISALKEDGDKIASDLVELLDVFPNDLDIINVSQRWLQNELNIEFEDVGDAKDWWEARKEQLRKQKGKFKQKYYKKKKKKQQAKSEEYEHKRRAQEAKKFKWYQFGKKRKKKRKVKKYYGKEGYAKSKTEEYERKAEKYGDEASPISWSGSEI